MTKEPTIPKETEHQDVENETKTILIPNSIVLEVDEEWGNALWDAVKRTQKETERKSRPPIEEIDFDQKTLELEFKSQYGDVGSEKSESSKAETMKTLPSFQGDYKAQSNIKKLPSHKKQAPPVFDMINLSALLAAPIKCTLPLADILKVKPMSYGKMWVNA